MRRNRQRPAAPGADIDRQYGLEPVFEPDGASQSGSGPTEFVTVACPYCGEPFGTQVDLSAGSCAYIEDCQVCCQPIELTLSIDDSGALQQVRASRCD
jgi:hypothetical protein